MSESRFTKKAGSEGGDGSLVFVKPADLARAGFNGVIAEGTFLQSMPNQFDDSKEDFKIQVDVEIELEGKDNNGNTYLTKVNAGDTLVINGAGNLNYLMKSVGPGNLCQINYFGKKEIAKGPHKGKLSHSFEVMYE